MILLLFQVFYFSVFNTLKNHAAIIREKLTGSIQVYCRFAQKLSFRANFGPIPAGSVGLGRDAMNFCVFLA